MSPLLAALLTAVLFCPLGQGKTVAGLFKSESARHQNGQFITRFMYQGSVNDGGGNYDVAQLSWSIKTCGLKCESCQDSNCVYNREYSGLSVLLLSTDFVHQHNIWFTDASKQPSSQQNSQYSITLLQHLFKNEWILSLSTRSTFLMCGSCQVAVVVFWCAGSITLPWPQRRSPGCCFTRIWTQTWTTWAARKSSPKLSLPVRRACLRFSCMSGLFWPPSALPPAVSLSALEHNQTIPHQFSPTAWMVVYADRYTCQVTMCQETSYV